MRIILAQSTEHAISSVATIVLDRLSAHPTAVIGLATGQTMVPFYEALVKGALEQHLSLDKNFFFMLDEYLGLEAGHPGSFKSYIQKYFIKPLELHESQFAFPEEHYERLIQEAGGIDLQLLGIGVNGHIGFNEPGSSKDSLTRVVDLSPETIKANQKAFGQVPMPTKALSMGISSILAAKELILLATGKSKAAAIKYLLNHHDDPACPATYLKFHPYFTLVLDPEAASKISLKI